HAAAGCGILQAGRGPELPVAALACRVHHPRRLAKRQGFGDARQRKDAPHEAGEAAQQIQHDEEVERQRAFLPRRGVGPEALHPGTDGAVAMAAPGEDEQPDADEDQERTRHALLLLRDSQAPAYAAMTCGTERMVM